MSLSPPKVFTAALHTSRATGGRIYHGEASFIRARDASTRAVHRECTSRTSRNGTVESKRMEAEKRKWTAPGTRRTTASTRAGSERRGGVPVPVPVPVPVHVPDSVSSRRTYDAYAAASTGKTKKQQKQQKQQTVLFVLSLNSGVSYDDTNTRTCSLFYLSSVFKPEMLSRALTLR